MMSSSQALGGSADYGTARHGKQQVFGNEGVSILDPLGVQRGEDHEVSLEVRAQIKVNSEV